MQKNIQTKTELIQNLNSYVMTPDDVNIRFKEKIKHNLLGCVELLYALNNPKYENELFDEYGNVNKDGDWSLYIGDNIRPYLFLPETQTDAKNYLCYTCGFQERPRYNTIECCYQITFTALCDTRNILDDLTGISRHDLIASIIRERFNWSNVFDLQCTLTSSKESITDTNYVTRTLVFEVILPNSIVQTFKNGTIVINDRIRR